MNQDLATSLSESLGIPQTHSMGKYMGIPIVHYRVRKQDYTYLVDKVRKKLNSWKAMSLSFAGRVTPAWSSLMNLPTYVMQTTSLPVLVCDEVERVDRDFIWGSNESHRKSHLVAWDTMCESKDKGGLGFRSLRIVYQCFIMKLAWQLVDNPDRLWVRGIHAKYGCGCSIIPQMKHGSHESHVWRSI